MSESKSEPIRVVFVEREHGPERLVCEAEIVFGEACGVLAGMKLVGFSLWRSPEGEVYVTFPSRAFGAGNERRFFDYLRQHDEDAYSRGASYSARTKTVKAWILGEYRKDHALPPRQSEAVDRALGIATI